MAFRPETADSSETTHLVETSSVSIPCPAGVKSQLDGLYAWQIARRKTPGRADLTGQRERFTPALFAELHRAWMLDPRTDGAYLDFDVFSGSQMATYGASVLGCEQLVSRAIDARVAVAWGRGGQIDPTPSLLDYRMVLEGETWKISEITYHRDNENYTLTSSLSRLFEAVRVRQEVEEKPTPPEG